MKLLNLTAKNFMPYKDLLSIDFPTDDSRNIMLVLGDNMRGKTSLLNAIRWGLYGKAVGRHSRKIPLHLMVNKDAALEDDWSMEVFLRFSNENDVFELRRTVSRKPLVATPSKDDDFQISTHLKKNGNLVSGDQVDSEINLVAPEQISRFFLFDGELLQEYEELLVEGSEQGRRIKETIEQVLGVPSLTKGRDELGALLKSARKKQSQAIAQISSLKGAAQESDNLATQLESKEDDISKLEEQLADARTARENLDEELEAAAAVIALGERLKSAKTTAENCRNTISDKTEEKNKVIANSWRDLLSAKSQSKKNKLLQRQQVLIEQTSNGAVLRNRLSETRRLLETSACPTCQQEISHEKRSYFSSIVDDLEAQISKEVDASAELRSVLAASSRLDGIRGTNACERLEQISKELRSAIVGLQRAENDIVDLEDQIEGSDPAALTRKRLERDERLREEGRLVEDIRLGKSEAAKINEKISVLQSTIQGMTEGRSEKATARVKLLNEIQEVFSASIEKLRDQLRSTVQAKASEAFNQMTTQKSYQGLEINENYGLSIIDSFGRTVPLRSAGAEQVVALSLIDGLNRTGRSTGPVVMDTPFGRLDAQHRDNILSYLPKVTSQLVLLVHSGEIRPETDLASVKDKVGSVYKICEVSENQSKVERAVI